MNPEISVIMLTYNREALISRAIESIFQQTFIDFEFIIVNNGSSDKSGLIADDYAAKCSYVKVIHRSRGNIGSGRNAGLDLASGTYITFIDDDDWVEPDFLVFLYSLATNNNADISICGSWWELEDNVIAPKYIYDDLVLLSAEEAVTELLLRNLYNSGMPTKLIKKELFDGIRFPNSGKYDDIATTYKLIASSSLIATQGKGCYYAVRHKDNNSGAATKHSSLNPQQLGEYLSAFHERTEYVSNVLPKLTYITRWSEWSYMISMVEKINRYKLESCYKVMDSIIDSLRNNRYEFLHAPWTQDFEKRWMEEYVL